MTAEVASASVALLPTFAGGAQAIQQQLGGPISKAGEQGGQQYGTGVMSTFKKFAGPIAGVFAGAKVVEYLNDATAAASDLNEAGTAGGVVFGEAFSAVEAFADTAAEKLGQSKLEALDGARTFGVFGKAAGLAGSDLVDFSTGLVGLSGDLASFYNTSPEEAIGAVGAALRGESEPIRQYGVLLDDATLKARALSSGLIQASVDEVKVTSARRALTDATTALQEAQAEYGDGSEEVVVANEKIAAAQKGLEDALGGSVQALTPAQRTMAAYQEILAQTSVAQGDFERTSGGLANQQRIAAAEAENFKAKFGEALLPIATDVTRAMNDQLFPALEQILPTVQEGIGVAAPLIVDLVEKLFPLIEIGGDLAIAVLPPLATGLGLVTDVAGPLLDVISEVDPALIAVVGGFIALNKLRPGVVDFFDRSSRALQGYQDRLAVQSALAQPMTQSYRGLQDLGRQIDYTERTGGRQLSSFGRAGSIALMGIGDAADNVGGRLSILEGGVGRVPNALGKITSFLGGPWGAAIGIGAGALTALAIELLPKAAENVDELTNSFEENTGAISENTRASVFKALQESGAVDAAKTIGLGLDTLTDAALGNKDAIALADAAMQAYNETQDSYTTGTTGGSSNIAAESITVRNAIGSQNDAVQEATQKFRDQQEATGAAAAAQKSFSDAVLAAQAAVSQNGATLDENTAQGLNNKAALEAIAEQATKLVDVSIGLGDASYVTTGKFAEARQSFIDTAVQMQLPIDQAQALADKLLAVPGQKVIDVQANTSGAQAALDAFIASNSEHKVTIATGIGGSGGQTAYAGGGTVFGPGTSKSDSILARLSAGEEVIQEPHATRHRALLKAINAGLDPMSSARFAAGGTVGGSLTTAPTAVASAGLPDINITVMGVEGQALTELARIVRNELMEALRNELRTAG